MIPYLGMRAVNSTVYVPWHSFAAATGAPAATTNFAVGDIQIYKNGGTTQRSSTSGFTATTSFDSNTGLQLIAIDLSDNADAGFYAAGSHYDVAVADVTIDGQTVRFWVGSFDIGVQPANVTQFGGTVATASGGRPEVNSTHIKGQAITGAGTAGNPWGP